MGSKIQFGYSILYVSGVPKTLAFYEKAFGLETDFLHDSKLYGELEAGATTLAFASNEMAKLNSLSVRANSADEQAAGHEVALLTDDPEGAYKKAVAAGATSVKAPETKPWGQVVGYVRDNNGCLVGSAHVLEAADGL